MSALNKFLEAQREVLGRLAERETQVGELYDEFARRLPELADFWRGVATEERGHAAQFQSLTRLLDKRQLFQNLGRFDLSRFDAFMSRVRAELATLGDAFTEERAFSMAMSVERTTVECGFFTTVESDAPEYRAIARHLAEAERDHIRRMDRRLQQLRQPTGVIGPITGETPAAPVPPPIFSVV